MDRFSDNKAGMTGLDKAKIQKVIEQYTSPKFNSHSQKQRQRIEERIKIHEKTLSQLTQEQILHAEKEMDALAQGIENERDLSKTIVHFDMDAFFAAVEMRDNSKLRCIPMAVGSTSMLGTSNYIARKFGVRSAMPGFIAKKLCPELIIVPGQYNKYREESAVIKEVLRQYGPDLRMGSLDEAHLDLTNFLNARVSSPEDSTLKRVRYLSGNDKCICRLPLIEDAEAISEVAQIDVITCSKCGKERHAVSDSVTFGNDVEDVVREIRFQVEQATGLTCSAGIAANGRLAKICSDIKKPNGQFRLLSEREVIVDFMRSLPIRKVSGIGAVTEALLKHLGIENCGDLFTKRGILKLLFSEISSTWFLYVALGASNSSWSDGEEDNNPKSASVERTFSPQKDINILLFTTRKLCHMLIDSLSETGIKGGRAATLKIKFATFDVITRCQSTNFLIKSVDALYPIVENILKKEMHTTNERNAGGIRLLGVRLSRLEFIDDDDEQANKDGGMQKSIMDYVRTPLQPRQEGSEPPVIIELCDSDEENSNQPGPSKPITEKFAENSLHVHSHVAHETKKKDVIEENATFAKKGEPLQHQGKSDNSQRRQKPQRASLTPSRKRKSDKTLEQYFPIDLT
ncbi:impB/mucB/samB family domain-containing protein [Ditylenchus destructor]|uniref:DNA polymerase kappa n=1 Tax=Ditylenchus destructor TaxID=166010 RepID=A0AAD4RDT7_9BILA|nr:impB/mucB/samB family domain-containing protein [Ditylenchus destructor]